MTSELPPTMVASPAFLLSKLGQVVARRFHEAMAPLGLHPRAYAVMSALASGNAAQVTVGERLVIDPSTMVAVIDGLELRRLVRRERDPDDRRRYVLSLTDEGRDLLDRADAAARAHTDAILRPLTAAQREELHALLLALLDGGNMPSGLPGSDAPQMGDSAPERNAGEGAGGNPESESPQDVL